MKSEKISPKELFNAIDQIYEEKGITKEYLIESLKMALEAAYRKNYETNEDILIKIDENSIKVCAVKQVVKNVEDPNVEIDLEEAKKISKRAKIGDTVNIEVTPKNFGRIAAVAGKQIIVQRLREAERNLVYTQYADKEGQIVIGVVQRTDKFGTIVDLGRVEALIPTKEQVKGEQLQTHQRIKAYVESVTESGKFGPQIVLSRKSPNFVKKLFELEIPEIIDGIVEIKSVAREAGSRTKVAVWSNDENIDPVGSLVGKKGIRIQPIIDELGGEKIDVVPYSEDVPSFIINALSPAPILAIDINDEEKTATVVVPDEALSYAIGAGGQNVRLAAILTGWKIDIKTETMIKDVIVE
ncbi:transcription termination factor NusA [Clostridium sp. CAG:1219]|nr:transcription termination factor NusA [Clostridium sp. CAG:1219]